MLLEKTSPQQQKGTTAGKSSGPAPSATPLSRPQFPDLSLTPRVAAELTERLACGGLGQARDKRPEVWDPKGGESDDQAGGAASTPGEEGLGAADWAADPRPERFGD